MKNRVTWLIVTVIVLGLLLSGFGCTSTSISPTPTTTVTQTPAQTTNPGAINLIDAVKNKRVMVVSLDSTAEGWVTTYDGLKYASEMANLGWNLSYVDSAGSVDNSRTILQQFTAAKPDAIVLLTVPSLLEQEILAARAAGIPVFSCWGFSIGTKGLLNDSYGDCAAEGVEGIEYMMYYEALKHPDRVIKVATMDDWDVPILGSRSAAVMAMLKNDPRFEVVSTHLVNWSQMSQDVTNAVTAAIAAHPDIDVYWNNYPAQLGILVAALKAAGKSDQIDVFSVTMDSISRDLLADPTSPVIAITGQDHIQCAWNTVEAMLMYFSNPTNSLTDQYSYLNWSKPITRVMSTKTLNLPAHGASLEYERGLTTWMPLYLADWQKRFGK